MTSVRVSFVSFSLGLTTILAVSAVTSHKIRKCNSYQVKTQIGKFRRNILTLSETLTPMLLLTMIELIRVMIIQYSLTYEETDYQKRKGIHILLIVLDVTINDLVLGVFLTCPHSLCSHTVPGPMSGKIYLPRNNPGDVSSNLNDNAVDS